MQQSIVFARPLTRLAAWWSAEKRDFALLMLLTGGAALAAQGAHTQL
jgi:hypothetical protein|tara:strand:+ start:1161 stop:1301 length:141 start_codon:yes stop_codon:yes gene_type:complete